MHKRLTKKVIEACRILSDNPISDIGDGVIEGYIQAGKVTYKQVYSLMKKFGYVWNETRSTWTRPLPAWLNKIEAFELHHRKVEDEELQEYKIKRFTSHAENT